MILRKLSAWGLLPLLFAAAAQAAGPDADPAGAGAAKSWAVYFGTYTGPKSKGIYRSTFDPADGKLGAPELASTLANPSFLAVHPSRALLYAACEVSDFGGKNAGAVSALAIQPGSGKLTLLNRQSSQGPGPCHVSVDRGGRFVLVANYGGGSIACLPIQSYGRLGAATSVVQHQGSGPNRRRQEGPHAHQILADPEGNFIFVPDLGLDKILVYRLDRSAGTLLINDPPSGATAPGAGPRHLAFLPDSRFAYAIDELDSTVTVFRYVAARGSLQALQSVSTLPPGFHGQNHPAEVAVHPSGKFLYASNRGHDSIAIFSIDAASGKLRPIGHQPTLGKEPRHFGIDPSGKYLLAANQNSDNVVVFRIDAATGLLHPTGQSLAVPSPVCIVWAAAE
jgi:6-phosphogluconolactonase